jgi:hypothetical protein
MAAAMLLLSRRAPVLARHRIRAVLTEEQKKGRRFAKLTCPIRTDRFSRVLFALGTAQLQPHSLICSLYFRKSSANLFWFSGQNCKASKTRLTACLIPSIPPTDPLSRSDRNFPHRRLNHASDEHLIAVTPLHRQVDREVATSHNEPSDSE